MLMIMHGSAYRRISKHRVVSCYSRQESEVLGTSSVSEGDPVAEPSSLGLNMLRGSLSADRMPAPQAVQAVATPLNCTQLGW
jgi:hypothetical protein